MGVTRFRIWRGDVQGGDFRDYETEVSEGMVVLDAVLQIQAQKANDLGVRWNCKAGKCGSCSAEVNGVPRLMCMTRLSDFPLEEPVTVEPMHAFPSIKDLVTDVSWNFEVKKKIKRFKPKPPNAEDGTWRMNQGDVDRVQEFRKCFSVRTCATYSVTINCTRSSSVHGSWCMQSLWKCTFLTAKIGWRS